MGQEHSSFSLAGEGGIQGIHRVHGSGSQVNRTEKDEIDEQLEKSKALPLPHQILPPPAVKDDVQSMLQGAQVVQELRTKLNGLLLGIEESPTLRAAGITGSRSGTKSTQGEKEQGENPGEKDSAAELKDGEEEKKPGAEESKGETIKPQLRRRLSSIEEFSKVSEEDTRSEQEKWARLGIDETAVTAMLNECTGGARLGKVLDKQELILSMILAVKEKAEKMRLAMDRNSEEARRTTQVLERLDRINVTIADVQDSLESAVATANILGASHFAHDDEMCSFKNFLKHNPPREVLPEGQPSDEIPGDAKE